MDRYETYLVLNGKRIELTEEQIKRLTENTDKKSPFKRQHRGGSYYYIDETGSVNEYYDSSDSDLLYDSGNYCTDRFLIEQRALHETLNRLLWRFSIEHSGDKIEWGYYRGLTDGIFDVKERYFISYNFNTNQFCVNETELHKIDGTTYFYSKTAAEDAIENVIKPFIEQHPGFVW